MEKLFVEKLFVEKLFVEKSSDMCRFMSWNEPFRVNPGKQLGLDFSGTIPLETADIPEPKFRCETDSKYHDAKCIKKQIIV